MSDEKKEISEVDKLINFIATNNFKGIFAKAGNELEALSKNTHALTKVIKDADISSTQLSKSLNRLTLWAVIIAFLAFALEALKLYLQKP